MSPGELIEAHERETKECSDCHDRFDRGGEGGRCLVCHEEVSADFESRSGLHGRLGGGRSDCRNCHTEHKGARADIVGLVAESFDHRRTGFELEGLHESVSCTSCHPRGEAYRDTEPDCVACHGDADPHRGELGEDCASCHSPESWSAVTFDHGTTRFALEGAHSDTSCASCHPGTRFEATPTDCVACHRVDDAHRGRLGPACGDCHSPSGWKPRAFDHAREARFALRGAHAKVACADCHRSPPGEVSLPRDCIGCHRMDDDHRGARGRRCGDCHGERSWSPARFDHTRDASFELHGAHSKIACELCHVAEPSKTATPTRCVACHDMHDVHQGTLGSDCSTCHSDGSWTQGVSFDHDFTDFPLLALHQLASCEDCHPSHRFADAGTECVECHARGDVHERRLGGDCARCHNPNGWRYWVFDHAKETDFALVGGHTELECVACHLKPTSGSSRDLSVSNRCSSCHLGDSPHDEAYGRDCQRCHVVESWSKTTQGVR